MDRDRHHDKANRASEQQHNSNQTHGIRKLWQALTALGSSVKGFMVYKSEPDLQFASGHQRCNYDYKARLYAYLSPLEEQRDWLERIYRKPE